MSTTFSMRGLLRSLSTQTTRPFLRAPATAALAAAAAPSLPASTPARRTLSTTPTLLARSPTKKPPKSGGKPPVKKLDPAAARALARKRKAQAAAKLDPKIAGLMKFLYAASQLPPPLRMARQRYLRHWVIHRAWMLFRRKQAEQQEREMMRMHQSMAHACEKLRNLEGPGTRPKGWLFRKAMEKVGVWSKDAVPIEYARPVVETPGHRPWNHEWKRT